MKLFKNILLSVVLLCGSLNTHSQVTASYASNIRTVRTLVNGSWEEPPVMMLGGGNNIEISFDDLQHEYVRYTYRITHCNADWTPSLLHDGDYMTGINGVSVIDDYEPSMNTEMLYIHYQFYLPNENHKLLLSGNYKVDIFSDDDDNHPVATACFSILEPKVGVEVKVSGNTDIDTYQTHQQVDFNINYPALNVINPESEFIPVVRQNRRWDNHVTNLKPTYLRNHQLVYTHNQTLIFHAGNEFRRFYTLDKYVPTMRIDKIRFEDPYYHAYIYEDLQLKSYKYDEDQNGRFVIRNSDNKYNDTESDYFYTHFTLKMPQVAGGNMYIHGDFSGGQFTKDYQMEYNLIDHQYELVLPLKQGSYNYQYLFVGDDSSVGQTAPSEGDFYQTENEYSIYIYHRPFGGRYDKLVGFATQKFQSSNK